MISPKQATSPNAKECRMSNISKYLSNLIDKLEEDNKIEEQNTFDEIAKIKEAYIEKNGQPLSSLNTENHSIYRETNSSETAAKE